MFVMANIYSRESLLILRFLGRHYLESFHVRELAKILQIANGPASENLMELLKAGLVTRRTRGRLALYRAEMSSALLREMKIVFNLMDLNPLVQELTKTSTRIILFGSCATGEDKYDSDIDILIECVKKQETFTIINRFQADIERELSPSIFTPAEFFVLRSSNPSFYSEIRKGITLMEESNEVPV
jgi:predicted nucleotidyltransferase